MAVRAYWKGSLKLSLVVMPCAALSGLDIRRKNPLQDDPLGDRARPRL